ncbi:MAG: DUF4214 domain-containing protein [Acidimicrobiia bacterium]
MRHPIDGARRRVREWRSPEHAHVLSNRRFVRLAYNVILGREPDPAGLEHYVRALRSHELTRGDVAEEMRRGMELRFQRPMADALTSLHHSRCDWVRSLPRARRILDLGGADQGDPRGALLGLGYPYRFERLVIVDLPHEDRHELYAGSPRLERFESPQGPIEYRYHSMTDFSGFEPGEFDLVFSGQTIEHVREDEADGVLAGAFEVLEPGGYLCLDTPNGPACRRQQAEFVNPDHKVEYGHAELSAKLRGAGFEILEARGLNHLGWILEGDWNYAELARNTGVYWEIEECYVLAYVCRKPGPGPAASPGGARADTAPAAS